MMRGDASLGAKFSGQAALTARLMMYVLLAIVLMALDHRGQYVPRLRAMANVLVEPVYYAVEWPVRALRGGFQYFQSTQALLRRNDRLAEELLAQQGQLQLLASLTEENARLRALVEGVEAVQSDFHYAELVDVDLDPFSHRILINRGRDRGVEVGQAVIDGAGVMGQVEKVQRNYATVRLISDPSHALPVQINRTGLRTVAFGMGTTDRLSLPSLPREADVREGDLLVTSGLGGRFPPGYPVAEITRIDRSAGRMFAEAWAQPLAALDRGREVLLLDRRAEPAPASDEEVPVDTHGDELSTESDSSSDSMESILEEDADGAEPAVERTGEPSSEPLGEPSSTEPESD